MATLAKVMAVVNLALALVVACLLTVLWAKQISWVQYAGSATDSYNQTRLERDAARTELTETRTSLERESAQLRTDLATANTARDGLERERNELRQTQTSDRTRISELEARSRRDDQLKQQQEETIKTIQEDLTKTRDDLEREKVIADQARQLSISLAAELKSATDQIRAQQAQTVALQRQLQALERRIADGGTFLGVNEDETPLDGFVIGVDGNLLIINKGEKDGARVGINLTISHGDQFKGRARIISVKSDMSVAEVFTQAPNADAVKVADQARTLN